MTTPDPTSLQRAEDAAVSGRPEVAQAWALIAIAKDVAAIRAELQHQRRNASREARRG
jgi:hypothetical protein